MKLQNIFQAFLLLFSICSHAQGTKMIEKREQINTLKIAFISNNLNLTVAEAEKFWPIYNSFEDKQFDLKHQRFTSNIKRMDDEILSKMSDKEALLILTQMETTEDEIYQLRKKLIVNLKSVLSPVKIIKLKKAEDEFNKKLLQHYKNKKSRR